MQLPASRSASRRGGFTIVEVLMVVAVIAILFTLVMVAASSLRGKASIETTKALIHRLKDALDEYKRLMGAYPPDGFDSEVKNSAGRPIWGSACLYEFLTQKLTVQETVAGQVRKAEHEPLMELKKSELTAEDPENPGVHEIKDGFGLPLHYDNTEDGNFNPLKQIENPHQEIVGDHPLDPRSEAGVVHRTGIQRPGAYDLWSHGSPKGHDPEAADLTRTIGNWNVEGDQKSSSPEGSAGG